MLEGVDVIGDGIADTLWARPTATVLGIDCPSVAGSSAAVPHEARARIDLRIPPGIDPKEAQSKLIEHLEAVAPWHVQLEFEREADGRPFKGATEGPGFDAMSGAMRDAYGRDVTLQGQGGSIPLCTVFQETFPDADIMLLGVEEPQCQIHAANESVDPSEIENIALAEVLFMQKYAKAKAVVATMAVTETLDAVHGRGLLPADGRERPSRRKRRGSLGSSSRRARISCTSRATSRSRSPSGSRCSSSRPRASPR